LEDGSHDASFEFACRLWVREEKHFHSPRKADNPTKIQTGYQKSDHYTNLAGNCQLCCPLSYNEILGFELFLWKYGSLVNGK
jgi:hypothetical protein